MAVEVTPRPGEHTDFKAKALHHGSTVEVGWRHDGEPDITRYEDKGQVVVRVPLAIYLRSSDSNWFDGIERFQTTTYEFIAELLERHVKWARSSTEGGKRPALKRPRAVPVDEDIDDKSLDEESDDVWYEDYEEHDYG